MPSSAPKIPLWSQIVRITSKRVTVLEVKSVLTIMAMILLNWTSQVIRA